MLDPALAALAAAGGTAVVQAAGTDGWTALRRAVARWFGRGDEAREQTESARLDRTAGELAAADADAVERARVGLEAAWRTRIEILLESLDETERAVAADQLRELVAPYARAAGASAGDGGVAVGGDVEIRADGGSAAAWHMGSVHVGVPDPPPPGAPQG